MNHSESSKPSLVVPGKIREAMRDRELKGFRRETTYSASDIAYFRAVVGAISLAGATIQILLLSLVVSIALLLKV
jgi:hypothetical protein